MVPRFFVPRKTRGFYIFGYKGGTMEFTKKEIKIFLLSGKARSGKETVSSMIKDYYSSKKVISISFAGYLKEYAKKILNWDGNENTKPRSFLQNLGVEIIKRKIDNEE